MGKNLTAGLHKGADPFHRIPVREPEAGVNRIHIGKRGIHIKLTQLFLFESGEQGHKGFTHALIGGKRIMGDQQYFHRFPSFLTGLFIQSIFSRFR